MCVFMNFNNIVFSDFSERLFVHIGRARPPTDKTSWYVKCFKNKYLNNLNTLTEIVTLLLLESAKMLIFVNGCDCMC